MKKHQAGQNELTDLFLACGLCEDGESAELAVNILEKRATRVME